MTPETLRIPALALTRRAMALRPCDGLNNWYRVEWAEHDGRKWSERTHYGSRFCLSARLEPTTCVEGTGAEMVSLARAILTGGSASFKRCAVEMLPDGTAAFESPRNSEAPAIVHGEDARDLARSILALLASVPA